MRSSPGATPRQRGLSVGSWDPGTHGSFVTAVNDRTQDSLCTVEHDGLDLAALPEQGLELLVVEEAVGRDVLQLENTARVRADGRPRSRSRLKPRTFSVHENTLYCLTHTRGLQE